MTTINVARYSDGRTVYNCRNYPYPPTNPKLGVEGNTVYWSEGTHEAKVVVPRQQDEYFSHTQLQTTPQNFLSQPQAKEKPPFISSNSPTYSKDLYGRVAPPILKPAKQQTDPSRYSTATNAKSYVSAPQACSPGKIPDKTAASNRYPNQYKPTYSVPFQ